MKNYIARIIGTDERYGLARDFIWSGKLRFTGERELIVIDGEEITISDLEDGLYEIADGYRNKYKALLLIENGKIVKEVSKKEAIEIAKKLDTKEEEEIDGEVVGEVTQKVYGVEADIRPGKIIKKDGEYYLNGKKLSSSDMIPILEDGAPKFVSKEAFEEFDEKAYE